MPRTRIPPSEQMRQHLEEFLAHGIQEEHSPASALLNLASRVVLQEALEAEQRDAVGRERYERLLAQARVEHRLPHAERSNEAYLAGGLWVVDHCDLLVVVWNGQPATGKGGTGDVVDYARRVGRPYIHIHTVERTITPSFQGGPAMDKFEEYQLFCVPAAVVNGSIRIEGMCPSQATLNNALREGGLCLK